MKTEPVRAGQQKQRSASPAPKVRSTKELQPTAKDLKLATKDRVAKAGALDTRRDASAKPRPKSEPKPKGENPSAKRKEGEPSKAVKRPSDAAKSGVLKCAKPGGHGKPSLSTKDAGPGRLGMSKEEFKANGLPRPMSQSGAVNGGMKALKAGPQNGHRRPEAEGAPPQKRPAEVAAPVLMATDVFEELGTNKKVKGIR